mmetsp:Transcript_7329/g.20679  ORF Transcript_7329/g.20679 Transcript_7329/m.20679 type:complete len:216 (-) Transcript_7329:215-862(-)
MLLLQAEGQAGAKLQRTHGAGGARSPPERTFVRQTDGQPPTATVLAPAPVSAHHGRWAAPGLVIGAARQFWHPESSRSTCPYPTGSSHAPSQHLPLLAAAQQRHLRKVLRKGCKGCKPNESPHWGSASPLPSLVRRGRKALPACGRGEGGGNPTLQLVRQACRQALACRQEVAAVLVAADGHSKSPRFAPLRAKQPGAVEDRCQGILKATYKMSI